MRRDPARFLTETAAELGDIVEFPIPRQRVFFVDDPMAVQRVLRDNHRAYGKRTVQYDALAAVTGSGLLTADLEPWRAQRRIQQPAFRHDALEPLTATVAGATDRMLARWERVPDGALIDVEGAMFQLSLEIVGEALFGSDLADQAATLTSAVEAGLARVVARAQNPLVLPARARTPGNLRMGRALAALDQAVAELIEQRRSRAAPASDLLGLLLEAGLDDRAVRDEVVTAIVAGHETVATALTWAWSLLGRNPAAADRLRDEVDQVARPGRTARPLSWADYPQLPWTRQVVDETLRLYPPAWLITRRALVGDVLAGVAVPVGALVIVCTYALHRRPDAWPDPERFDPSRFADDRRGDLQRSAYAPFGSGPRLCIGRDFALLEAVLVLARVSQRYVLRPHAGPPPATSPLVTLRPKGGLSMLLERRTL